MNHTKKMILVTPEEAATLRDELPQPSAPAGSLNAMDIEMKSILDEQGSTDHDKWLKYRQVLLKFMTKLREKNIQAADIIDMEPAVESEQLENSGPAVRERARYDLETYNSDVLATFRTERLKKKARVLMSLLRRNQDISWDGRGAVTIGGSPNPSPLHALVSAAVSNAKTNKPRGWAGFHGLLQRMRVPADYIGKLSKSKQPKTKSFNKITAKWRPY
jgi:hypothetical protein